MKFSRYILLLFVLLLTFNSYLAEAAEVNNIIISNKEVIKKDKIEKKGFLKKLYRKISEKVKKTKQKIVRKFKRQIAKRKARKNIMRGSVKQRNKNLYNVLIYSIMFLLFASLITVLLYYSIITFNIFLVLAIILTVTTTVIALIYFSRRYTVKPNFK